MHKMIKKVIMMMFVICLLGTKVTTYAETNEANEEVSTTRKYLGKLTWNE